MAGSSNSDYPVGKQSNNGNAITGQAPKTARAMTVGKVNVSGSSGAKSGNRQRASGVTRKVAGGMLSHPKTR